jgi:hypothetical protein
MIKKPMNWENVQEIGERKALPLGAYVCKVKQVRVQDNSYGSQLALLFDIAEGEHAGFYNRDFTANTDPNKKWKGLLRVWLPKDDGSEKDEITKRVFKGFITAFERSNPGYTAFVGDSMNENSLAGKTIGIMYRNEEWSYEGKQGWAVRPFKAISADTVREGNYTLPKDKSLSNKASTTVPPANVPAGYTEVDTEELPWD